MEGQGCRDIFQRGKQQRWRRIISVETKGNKTIENEMKSIWIPENDQSSLIGNLTD